MAKLVKPHRFRATLFADGARGTYFQEWQSEKYPCLFIRIHGSKRDHKSVKQVFVKRRDLEIESFDTIEKALPTARKQNWNPYEKSNVRPRNTEHVPQRGDDRGGRGDSKRRQPPASTSAKLVRSKRGGDRARGSVDDRLVEQSGSSSKRSCVRRKPVA